MPLLYALGAANLEDSVSFFNTGFQLGSIAMRSVVWALRALIDGNTNKVLYDNLTLETLRGEAVLHDRVLDLKDMTFSMLGGTVKMQARCIESNAGNEMVAQIVVSVGPAAALQSMASSAARAGRARQASASRMAASFVTASPCA